MTSDVRLVPISREQIERWINNELKAAWDASPADPVEAVVDWFNKNFMGADEEPDSVRNGAGEILAALGWEAE